MSAFYSKRQFGFSTNQEIFTTQAHQLTPWLSSISDSPPKSNILGQSSSSSSSSSSLSSLSLSSSSSLSSLSLQIGSLSSFSRSSSSTSSGDPLLLTLRLTSRYSPALPLPQSEGESSQKSHLLIYDEKANRNN